jgi:hypothetical protein
MVMEREIEINGYVIHYTINWVQNGTIGIGQYEYWGSTYTDIGLPIWDIESIEILSANTPEDEEIDIDSCDMIAEWQQEIKNRGLDYSGEND